MSIGGGGSRLVDPWGTFMVRHEQNPAAWVPRMIQLVGFMAADATAVRVLGNRDPRRMQTTKSGKRPTKMTDSNFP